MPASIGHSEFIGEKIPHALSEKWKTLQRDYRREGHLSTLLLIEDTLFLFHFLDSVRPESISMIQRLKKQEGMNR